MKKSSLAIIIIVVIVAIGGLWYWYSSQSSPSSAQPGTTEQTTTSQPISTATNTASAPAPAAATITYTDSGFSPSTLTVAKGTTVTFKNDSSSSFYPASDPHPLHNGYPTTGGCVGSTFDACASIPSGSSWSFTFNIAGSWGYHNHLNPSQRGTVAVQ